MELIVEVASFLLFWIYDLIKEIIFAVFRCRPQKEIISENILITGTGSGFGRLLATKLGRDGNILHCVDINAKLNQETAATLQGRNCKVYTYTCNVSELKNVRELKEQIKKNTPDRHISYLFNIAGIVCGKLFAEATEEEMDRVIQVNLTGVMYLCKMVWKDMLDNYGHIVNMSSSAGIMSGPRAAEYCASKFGVRGLTQALMCELDSLKADNVHVTSIHPHIADTGMFNNTKAKFPLLAPILDPEWVVDETIKATKENKLQVILPTKMGQLLLFPEQFMSMVVFRRYSKLLGNDAMKDFVKIRDD